MSEVSGKSATDQSSHGPQITAGASTDLTVYTDGNWYADGLKVRVSPANMVICTASDLGISRYEASENARLISAAPDMRLALQRVRDELTDAIDGGEECKGRDQWLSRLIERCDKGLSKIEMTYGRQS